MKKVLIFDFDGTIADSFSEMISIFNEISPKFGFQKLNLAKIEELRDLSSKELIKKFEISKLKIPFIIREARKSFNKRLTKIKPVRGIKAVLESLNKNNNLGILTSNSKENVENYLKSNDLELFDFIHSENSMFGKGKILKKIVIELKANKSGIIYIGDETRDIEAAIESGVKVIAVGWGFNSKEILAKYNPNCLINKPEELLEAVSAL